MKFLKLLRGRHDGSMFNIRKENELYNAFLGMLIVISIFVFVFPIYGIIAVLAWVMLAITLFVRKYSPVSIMFSGVIAIVLIAYQTTITIDYVNDLNKVYDYVILSPTEGDWADGHIITLDIQHEDEIFSIYYQFATSRVWYSENWLPLDEGATTITTDGLRRDAYFLIIKVNLQNGAREYYTEGRYRVGAN